MAQAAACAGYTVLLLEKTRLAAGSSSRSSKLIHGGLRYLEGHDYALVRESLAERALLLKLAVALPEPDIEPVPGTESEQYEPGLQGCRARQRADNFSPVQRMILPAGRGVMLTHGVAS